MSGAHSLGESGVRVIPYAPDQQGPGCRQQPGIDDEDGTSMRRAVVLRVGAALAAAVTAAAAGAAVPMLQASAAPAAALAAAGNATGFASANGGTTGGAGGQTVRATTGTAIHQALCSRASSSTPITIQVEGTINHGNTSKVSGSSCNTAAGVIELKQISNVTIIGVGNGAVFDQLGIHIREASNIIIQNVTVRNVKKSGSPTSNGGDAIGMESDVRNVWVDHVTLEASGGESEGFDGLFDMKNNTQYVTLSYSILRNSGRGGLIGSSESDRSNGNVTFHHNLYSNIDSRTPPAARRHRPHVQQPLQEPARVRHQLAGRRPGEGGQQLLRGLQGRPRHLLHRRGRLLAGQRQHLRQRDLGRPRRRAQPGRPEPAVQHQRERPLLLRPRRRELRARHREQDGGRQQGPAGVERQLHPDQSADGPDRPAHRPHGSAHGPAHGPAQRHEPQPRRGLRRLQQGQRHELRQRA
ncbi:polysaccharide lyase family 1 protein [Nonomuraea salmonea]|uniref:pectate lyase family protein n=1 Tax=Nonomuraea salmonea TaxID=46181 RepID=UPI0031EA2BE4